MYQKGATHKTTKFDFDNHEYLNNLYFHRCRKVTRITPRCFPSTPDLLQVMQPAMSCSLNNIEGNIAPCISLFIDCSPKDRTLTVTMGLFYMWP